MDESSFFKIHICCQFVHHPTLKSNCFILSYTCCDIFALTHSMWRIPNNSSASTRWDFICFYYLNVAVLMFCFFVGLNHAMFLFYCWYAVLSIAFSIVHIQVSFWIWIWMLLFDCSLVVVSILFFTCCNFGKLLIICVLLCLMLPFCSCCRCFHFMSFCIPISHHHH